MPGVFVPVAIVDLPTGRENTHDTSLRLLAQINMMS